MKWTEANRYAELKTKKDPHHRYSLPTEAQFEVAMRGGRPTAYVCGDDPKNIGDYVWYCDNSSGMPHPVKSKLANAYGFYRITWEWVLDWYAKYDVSSVAIDPTGPASGVSRVYRGGGFFGFASRCRSACRGYSEPDDHDGDLGFRLVRT